MVQANDHAEKLYGKPKPRFEPQISIESRPVDNVRKKGHLYLVYRDENGKKWALSGRHENYHKTGISSNWFHSNIIAEILPQEESIDRLNNDTPEDRYSAVIIKGDKALTTWEEMAKTVTKINKAKIDYDMEGSNSNSVISLALSQGGFDPLKVIPERKDMWEDFTGNFPGVGDLVIDENGNVREKTSLNYEKSQKKLRKSDPNGLVGIPTL
ncbi:hypothetical protein [Kiloniella sp.]|uniref:hypothetical protein n=1 Tax=Kiloniella sp. TaxID=1938587 RepID=UPI003B023D47